MASQLFRTNPLSLLLAEEAGDHRLRFRSRQARHVGVGLFARQHVLVHVRWDDAERNTEHFEELLAAR